MSNIASDMQWLDATAQAELIATSEATSTELVDAANERIERLDGDINAVIMRWFDRARAQAAAFDELPLQSDHRTTPFAGVPFLIKDLGIHAAGMPITSGNRAALEAQPLSTHDSYLMERFRDAGLITLGRTNSPEFGSLPVTEPLAYGPTRNPWNTGHTPGGSSGGAAAAVAGRNGADRPCERWRRLDPHPCVVFRSGRVEADAGSHLDGSRTRRVGPEHAALRQPQRA